MGTINKHQQQEMERFYNWMKFKIQSVYLSDRKAMYKGYIKILNP